MDQSRLEDFLSRVKAAIEGVKLWEPILAPITVAIFMIVLCEWKNTVQTPFAVRVVAKQESGTSPRVDVSILNTSGQDLPVRSASRCAQQQAQEELHLCFLVTGAHEEPKVTWHTRPIWYDLSSEGISVKSVGNAYLLSARIRYLPKSKYVGFTLKAPAELLECISSEVSGVDRKRSVPVEFLRIKEEYEITRLTPELRTWIRVWSSFAVPITVLAWVIAPLTCLVGKVVGKLGKGEA